MQSMIFTFNTMEHNNPLEFSTTSGKSKELQDRTSKAGLCVFCQATQSPEWRNGPQGPRTLCNRCGLRYKREQKQAAAYAEKELLTAATSRREGTASKVAESIEPVTENPHVQSDKPAEAPSPSAFISKIAISQLLN